MNLSLPSLNLEFVPSFHAYLRLNFDCAFDIILLKHCHTYPLPFSQNPFVPELTVRLTIPAYLLLVANGVSSGQWAVYCGCTEVMSHGYQCCPRNGAAQWQSTNPTSAYCRVYQGTKEDAEFNRLQ
ncbi:predicted protein [Plenodomus lingam JN3]|uniref:Predicted protein n=1 Tax=Leptosphaeria maculans (strain JN3 / isolate v23.1.3 / race Av1-4-5-6-7-8) TaxID=985895 RepID=E4ZIN8_LEPMJ|nr:predicted protein [Plenodomus lingam JN3]CBX91059.1 predicted protein [Plenodomus lingam JN3]